MLPGELQEGPGGLLNACGRTFGHMSSLRGACQKNETPNNKTKNNTTKKTKNTKEEET